MHGAKNIFLNLIFWGVGALHLLAQDEVKTKLRPVDGRGGGWNSDWKSLSYRTGPSKGRDVVSVMLQVPFEPCFMIRIKEGDQAPVLMYTIFNEKNNSVVLVEKNIQAKLVGELNKFWVEELLKTSYSQVPEAIVNDDTIAFFGATVNDRTYYLMGQASLNYNKDQHWMFDITSLLSRYALAKAEEEEEILKIITATLNAK